MDQTYGIDDLNTVLKRLRDAKTGCPWNIKQTIDSLLVHTVEETFEVMDALSRRDWPHSEEELGDLLFHIAFYAHIASEQQHFSMASLIDKSVRKLIFRHPHVFPDGTLSSVRAESEECTEAEVNTLWRQRKAQSHSTTEVETNVPSLLQRAYRQQKQAAAVGFDWPTPQGALDKLHEEVQEVVEVSELPDSDDKAQQLSHEIGDVLFSIVNVARHYAISPDVALKQACERFGQRFSHVERYAEDQGGFEHCTLEMLESAWQLAKKDSK